MSNMVNNEQRSLNRYMFRKQYRIERIKFLDTIYFQIEDLADSAHTSFEYIEKRYAEFLKHHFDIDMGDKNTPYIESLWDEFVKYENGGKPFDAKKSFKEPLYPKHSDTDNYQFKVFFQKDPKNLFLNSSEAQKDDDIPF